MSNENISQKRRQSNGDVNEPAPKRNLNSLSSTSSTDDSGVESSYLSVVSGANAPVDGLDQGVVRDQEMDGNLFNSLFQTCWPLELVDQVGLGPSSEFAVWVSISLVLIIIVTEPNVTLLT